jgi:S1-C subfamily serine protease
MKACLPMLACVGALLFLSSGEGVEERQVVLALQDAVQQVISQAEESVVYVLVARGEPYEEPPRDEPGRLGAFPSSPKEKAAAEKSPHVALDHRRYLPEHYGSGVVLDERGLILTTYHVVRGARKVLVRLIGGRMSYANIHAADPRSDLAVLELLDKSLPLKPLPLGDAARLRKGQFLLALAHRTVSGNRDGGPSASWGILSNWRRRTAGVPDEFDRAKATLYHYGPLIQTDARLAQGTSGGALLNLQGELVGLTTTLAAVTDQASAACEGVPIDATRKRIIEVLRTGGEVEYGFLGVTTLDLSPEQLRAFNILDGGAVQISEEIPAGTPAARAQLRRGDVVLAVNRTRVRDGDDLFVAIATTLAGSPVELEIIRDRQRRTVSVKQLAKQGAAGRVIASQRPPAFRGLRVDYLTTLVGHVPSERVQAALRQGGVVVREVQAGSPAARAGLQADDIITHVHDRAIDSPADFERETRQATGPVPLRLLPSDGQGGPRLLRIE